MGNRALPHSQHFPARNTSVTDLLALLDTRWFGTGSPRGAEGHSTAHADIAPPAPAAQPTNGRRSGSSDKLLVGSDESSLGAVTLYPASAAAEDRETLPPRLPPPASQQPPQQEPPSVQAVRVRSEPLPANGVYSTDAANGGGAGGGGKQEGGAGGGPLGTWAARQRVFLQQQAKLAAAEVPGLQTDTIQEEDGAGPSAAPAPAFMRLPPSPTSAAAAAPDDEARGQRRESALLQRPESVDEEDEVNAAWRWRFARKWQTEQAKQFDPEYGREGGDDEWGEALGYMDALAGGLNLQIARTVSTDQYASLPLVSPTLSQSMLLDASIKESPLTSTIEDSSMNATKHIVAVARRAQQLLQQQQEIERQVEQRWESATAGQPWVGQHLPAVTVDSWGRFPFVLVRLLDRSNRHKVLVRGKNGAEEGALFAQLEQEVSRAAVQHRLPGPRLELLGSGMMEWSRERDRCLNVTASKLHSLTDARLRSKGDVSRLAGALAQSSLPVTYKILVEGRPSKGPGS